MFIFHIDLTLKVAIVTENGRQYKLKWRKNHFGPQFGGSTHNVFKTLDISTAKYENDISLFYIS